MQNIIFSSFACRSRLAFDALFFTPVMFPHTRCLIPAEVFFHSFSNRMYAYKIDLFFTLITIPAIR